jgi:hypothetical protein
MPLLERIVDRRSGVLSLADVLHAETGCAGSNPLRLSHPSRTGVTPALVAWALSDSKESVRVRCDFAATNSSATTPREASEQCHDPTIRKVSLTSPTLAWSTSSFDLRVNKRKVRRLQPDRTIVLSTQTCRCPPDHVV